MPHAFSSSPLTKMAPSRRLSNGRSPLVNQQSQITSFFSKTTTSPSPSTISKQNPKINPNPKSKSTPKPKIKPNPIPKRSPSPGPTTPPPHQTKSKKPLLVIGPTTTTTPTTPEPLASSSYGEEVVSKRIRVYWPLDKKWYEGCVKSFNNKSNGKHLVEYEDGDEEELDLGKEKIEWVEEEEEVPKGFKRLRKVSIVVEDDEEEEEESGGNDDKEDEDWGNQGVEDDESEDMELEEECENEKESKGSRKRKASGGETTLGPAKKRKSGGEGVKGLGCKDSLVGSGSISVERKINIDSE